MKDMIAASEAGNYSAFVNNIHPIRYNGVDPITHTWANGLWAYAQANNIPMIVGGEAPELQHRPRGIELQRPGVERNRAQLHVRDTDSRPVS